MSRTMGMTSLSPFQHVPSSPFISVQSTGSPIPSVPDIDHESMATPRLSVTVQSSQAPQPSRQAAVFSSPAMTVPSLPGTPHTPTLLPHTPRTPSGLLHTPARSITITFPGSGNMSHNTMTPSRLEQVVPCNSPTFRTLIGATPSPAAKPLDLFSGDDIFA